MLLADCYELQHSGSGNLRKLQGSLGKQAFFGAVVEELAC